jgi:hypothetical protein
VERSEAEAIYAQGREPVVDALLALSARLEAQDAQLAAPAERVEVLEQRLRRDSRNSSLMPSTTRPGWGSGAGSRRDGAQAGRPAGTRRARARAVSDRAGDGGDRALAAACACGHVFGEAERTPVGASVRHQVAEPPPLAVEISELVSTVPKEPYISVPRLVFSC